MSGFFKINHSEARDFTPVPPGTYEVYISEVEKKTFNSGSQGLNLTLTIRDDVEQPSKKRKIFNTLVCVPTAMLNWQNYAKATQMPDGTEYANAEAVINAFGKYLKGKPVRVTIAHDKTRDKFIEQVKSVAASEVGGNLNSANPFSVPGNGQATPQPEEVKLPWEEDGNVDGDDTPIL